MCLTTKKLSHMNTIGSKSVKKDIAKILLKIDYDRKSSNLIVNIIKCENLYDSKNEAYDPWIFFYWTFTNRRLKFNVFDFSSSCSK